MIDHPLALNKFGERLSGIHEKIRDLTSQYVESLGESAVALERHVDTLTTILESLGAGLLVIDLNYKILLANDSALKITRASPGNDYVEQVESNFALFSSAGERLGVEKAPIVKAILQNREIEEEIYVKSANLPSSGIWVSVHAAPIHDSCGKLCGAVSVFHDITEQKLAIDRMSNLYHEAPCGYHSLDKDGRIIEINKTEIEWLGLESAEAAKGAQFRRFLLPSSLPVFEENLARLFEGGNVHQVLLELEPINSHSRAVFWSSRGARQSENPTMQEASTRCTLFDVTERLRAEKQRDALSTLITHDIKNHLAAERTLLDFVVSTGKERMEPSVASLLDDLRVSNGRYLTLVTNLLHLYRFEKESFRFIKERIKLGEIIDLSIESNASLIGIKKIDCRVAGDPRLEIFADRSAISHVVHNLLQNAITSSVHGGIVKIEYEKSNDHSKNVVLRVIDQGPGLSENLIREIFKPKWKWNASTSTMSSLGLALCKQIVELHGGMISVDSSPDQGAVFTVFLESLP